nr:uncharacterized protein LOC105342216 isoform X1 [Crassostrea gigas]XP_034320282.1 uncharacterized protein LOC105342216 isoform X1 [Crassostrea gigas]XP_034320283.1 uncharacterized protein LOC105342216 isoform X1 [Crassostrea gigas]
MSNSKFKLTGENTNLARVAQLILGPCTNVLRDVLRKEISPSNLETKVRAYIAKTKKPLINQHQETLVYSKDYLKFDVTLLYFLLRNMCSIQPHSNKWGNNPKSGDRSVSGNIERIRLIRNEYGHNSERFISDTDFKIKYKYIKVIVKELENYLGSSTKYQDEVKELKTCTMDPTQSEKNIKDLLDLHEKIKDISGDVEEMKKTVLPWNIKVIYKKDVLKWKEDDSFFVETHNFQAMLDKVRQQPFVTFVGVPGSGKTATARHIAILLQEKDGYEILPTKDINNTEMYCDPRNPQVFVIDDVLGVFGFDMKELEKLTMYQERLNEPSMPATKVLMTCREVVFKHEAFSGSILSNKKHLVQLHSEENALNDQDKYDLFAKYNLDKDLLSADTLSKISKSFPYLCKLFSRKEELGHYGPQFFISPVPCILELLDIMKIRNKVHYASLVLLMTNQNSLSEKDFNNENTTYFHEMKFQALKRCKVDPTTCSFYFIDALTEMEGTYTEQSQSEFEFIHDSMLEIIAYHFGRHFPELILQYMDSDYIANYIKPGTYKRRKRKREDDELEQSVGAREDSDTVASKEYVHDLCIKLQESHYHLLADRLFKDIHRGELFNVFENEALKHPLVLKKFLDVMKSKPYSELFTVFLSELKNKVKRGKKTTTKIVHSKCYNLLMNSKWADKYVGFYRCVRAIDWVIFYGHNQILQFIIDQIIKNTSTVNDLFRTPFNIRSDDFCTTEQGTDCNKRNELDIDENSAGRCDVSEDESWSDLCIEKSDQSFGTEPVFVEKRRLLNLSCYSGDFLTFKTLLQYRDNDVLLSESWWLLYNHNYDDNEDDKDDENDDDDEDEDDDWNIFDPPIVVASKTGHFNILLELLGIGANVNNRMYCNKSLVVACSKGHLNIVIELLKHKANVNTTDYNRTPLIAACLKGYYDIVLELIKHGADVNITVYSHSPLISACSKGHVDIVLQLLKRGADVNMEVLHKSPLIAACSIKFFLQGNNLLRGGEGVNSGYLMDKSKYDACSKVQLVMILELLKYKADVNFKNCGDSPLNAACSNEYINEGVVRELLKYGADVNLTNTYSSPLIAACRTGRLDLVIELLKHGADVNLTNTYCSPLISACDNGRFDSVIELLKHGADVNITGRYYSPLIAACSCQTKNLDIISELLRYGADANGKVSYNLPLIIACAKGHLDIVHELLKHGADVNAIASYNSPLLEACSKGYLNIVLQLLKHGADVNAIVSNNSPLLKACSKGHLNIVFELLKHGANVNAMVSNNSSLLEACSKGHLNIVLELLRHGADVNAMVSNNSPLLKACSRGHLNIVQELLKHGADANITVSDKSPLIAACSKGNYDVINELLNYGADVNRIVSGWSPLTASCFIHYDEITCMYNQRKSAEIVYTRKILDLCSKVHLNIIRALIKHGADINGQNCTYSPIIASCLKGHSNIVSELLLHGADVNQGSDCSPLTAACSQGHLSVVKELLKHGADVNMSVSDSSPLIAACSKGYLDIISLLSKHGANLNITVSDNSSLLSACSQGHLSVVNELLKQGADVNITVSDSSPLIVACSEGYLDIISLLLKHGANVNITVSGNSPLTASCLIDYRDMEFNLSKQTAYANTISDETLCRLSCSKVHLAIVRQLLKHGADVNAEHCKDSPLNASCSRGNLNIVCELLKHEADVNIIVNDCSPLITACQEGQSDIVHELLKHGVDVNITVPDNSPLIAACTKGNLTVVFELLKHGADVKITVSDNSPLIAACTDGHLDIVLELLKHGADVNITVSDNSPLIAACAKGHLDVIPKLLRHGADVNSTVSDISPYIAACSIGTLMENT